MSLVSFLTPGGGSLTWGSITFSWSWHNINVQTIQHLTFGWHMSLDFHTFSMGQSIVEHQVSCQECSGILHLVGPPKSFILPWTLRNNVLRSLVVKWVPFYHGRSMLIHDKPPILMVNQSLVNVLSLGFISHSMLHQLKKPAFPWLIIPQQL